MNRFASSSLAGCCLLLMCSPLWAMQEVRIGILAYRPVAQVKAQWQPLAEALNKALPEAHFDIDAYDYDGLFAAVSSRQIDFVLTNPASYLLMTHRSGLTAPLVTLSNLEQGVPVNAMGGVIFTRADRNDIDNLQDLRGHSVAITSTASLGGYEMQAYELLHGGLHIPQDLLLNNTGMPQEKVVTAVLEKSSDVGFIRSGILESLAAEGKLDLKQIKVINRQNLPGFPVAVSTRLYPEWPLAALPQTNKDLKRKLAAYLLTLDEHRELTQALRINGFDVPSDYSSVETVLRELRLPPFDAPPVFTTEDIWLQYRWQSIFGLIALSLITLLSIQLYLANRRLLKEKRTVQAQAEQLGTNNKLLDSIIENIPVMIYLKRADDLSYTMINRRGEALLGYSREALLTHTDKELFEPTQAAATQRDDKRAIESTEAIVIPEEYIQTANGPRILYSKKIMLRDEQGQPAYLLGIAEDITERITADQRLQELNDNLAATLQAIPDLLFEMDRQGTYLNIWAQDPKLLYSPIERLIGRTVHEILPTPVAQTVIASLAEAQRDGISRGHVLQLKFPTETRWFELSVSLKSNRGSSDPRYIVLSRDITERKLAEQTLSQNEERLRLALAAAKQGWYDVNVQTGKVLVSPEYIKMLGHDPETFQTDLDNWIAGLHPDDSDQVLETFRQCLASGGPRTMEYRRLDAHGSWMWISSVGLVSEWDQQHQPMRVVGIHTDISERKQAEAKLQHANRSFAILSAVNRNLVHATDEKRLLHSVCKTIVEQHGYRMAWVGYLEQDQACSIRPVAEVGASLGYLDHADIVWADTPRGQGTSGRAARSGVPQVSQDIQNDPSMGIWRDAASQRGFRAVISLPLLHMDQVFAVLSIYADQCGAFTPADIELLTEMANDLAFGVKSLQARHERDIALEALSVTALQLERANQQVEEERVLLAERVEERTAQLSLANKAKDAFLATMSHEIRTPLGGMLGMLELLELSHLDEKQDALMKVARQSGQNLLRIVDDILDWSKIEAGKLAIDPSPARLADTLHTVQDTYAQLARAKGLELHMDVDPHLSDTHLYDPLRVAQILHNFISNALKFTQRGHIELSAKLVASGDGKETVQLCVRDTGIGIASAQLQRLFEHYEQASVDTARMYGGTGLGLAISRSLAELMNGTLSVESKSGQGSTFCLTLKLDVSHDVSTACLLADASSSSAHHGPMTIAGRPVSILIVDDHPINRMLLKEQLDSFGIRVEAAADGEEALLLWRSDEYDLIITDCHMPEMDGYELTRSIRNIEQAEGLHRTPILAWTANVLSDELPRSLGSGMDDLLTKPTELHTLYVMLTKWLPMAVSPPPAPTEQLPAIDDTALLDFAVLGRIARCPEAQTELLKSFILHNQTDLTNLLAALQGADSAAVAHHAHRIKGASRMIGAHALLKLSTAIEQAALNSDLPQARALADASLPQLVGETERHITAYLDTQTLSG